MADNYHTRLNAVGIRPSVQRVAVYAYLCEHPVHPTVETVYSALSSDYPTLSKTTIYNTLRLFEEKKNRSDYQNRRRQTALRCRYDAPSSF